MICSFCPLTLSTPYILQSCIKMKNNLNFYFHPSLWCLKRVEALQRSVKIKISVNFLSSTRIGTGGIKNWKISDETFLQNWLPFESSCLCYVMLLSSNAVIFRSLMIMIILFRICCFNTFKIPHITIQLSLEKAIWKTQTKN